MPEKLLLHICCAPCAIGAFEALTQEGFEVKGFFYNPNIHPLIEFRRRLKAVKVLRDRLKLDIDCNEEYGLREFLHAVAGREDDRCPVCYALRFGAACAKAAKEGIGLVTTTLLGSPHQDHALIARAGEEAAKAHGVKFLVRDFRPYHQPAHDRAREMKLYRQQYCGCVFSEFERYKDSKLHLYKGDRK
jgi:predicted adenine nucleotide alpha hydrolase (AANH) superfamily ATPase